MRPLVALCLLLAAGCGSSSSDDLGAGGFAATPPCNDGDSRECACPGGAGVHGAQYCVAAEGGFTWGECQCTTPDAGDEASDAAACATPHECGCVGSPGPLACPLNISGQFAKCDSTPPGCTQVAADEWCCP